MLGLGRYVIVPNVWPREKCFLAQLRETRPEVFSLRLNRTIQVSLHISIVKQHRNSTFQFHFLVKKITINKFKQNLYLKCPISLRSKRRLLLCKIFGEGFLFPNALIWKHPRGHYLRFSMFYFRWMPTRIFQNYYIWV